MNTFKQILLTVAFLWAPAMIDASMGADKKIFGKFDEAVVNATTGTPLGGFGCGGVKFDGNTGTFAVMTQPPADAYDFVKKDGARLSLSVKCGKKIETIEQLKAGYGNDGLIKDDAIWPLHRVDFGTYNGVHVKMTGYSPLDNINYDNMHLPYALYEIVLSNVSDSEATAKFQFHWEGSPSEWSVLSDVPEGEIALKPKQSKTLRYVLAWYCQTDSELGYYMNQYDNPHDIAKHGLKVFDKLKANAEHLVNSMRASNLPKWFVNQTLNTLSAVVVNGMYKKDGRTAFAEGQWTCFGTMDQMWLARTIIYQLLPLYAWQELEYWARTQMKNGQIHHDCNFENKAKDRPRRSLLVAWDDTEHDDYRNIQRWVDLNCAFIISVYEAYRATADKEMFLSLWPNVKRAAQRILTQVKEYGSKEYPYTFVDTQNSYDHGGNPDPYNAQLSAVAYRIMTIFAEETGEKLLVEQYEKAYNQVVESFHNRYIRDKESLTGMHCESVFTGQWLSIHLGLGEIWSKDDTEYVLSVLNDYYKPAENGLGFEKGTYDEWTPYLLTHYGGLLLQTGNISGWLSLQKDSYIRQYLNRDNVFDHRLNILPKAPKQVKASTNIKSKGQYISMPAIWRNYYEMIGLRRDARTHELWLTPLCDVEKAFFITPESNGTLSFKTHSQKETLTIITEKNIKVSTLYLRNNAKGDIKVLIDGKLYPHQSVGTGYSKYISVKWNKKVKKNKPVHITVCTY